MATSIFIWPGLFSVSGTTVTFSGSTAIPTTSSYGFTGVSNAFGMSGTSTAVLASDGGAYLLVATGGVFVNSASLWFGTGGAPDSGLSRLGAASFALGTNSPGDFTGAIKLNNVTAAGANGQSLALLQLTELTTIAAAATTDTAIQMPANAIVLAVSVRTTVTIPTAATYTVGDSGSAARFSTAAVSTTAPSTDQGTKAGAYYNTSALSIRITPNLTPGTNVGRVRVTIYYFLSTAPTS